MIGSKYQSTLELLSKREPEEVSQEQISGGFEIPVCYRCINQITTEDFTFIRFRTQDDGISIFDFHKNCYYRMRRIKSLRHHPI